MNDPDLGTRPRHCGIAPDERASMTVDTLGGPQQMVVVSEPGLYALMLISRSPKAKSIAAISART